MNDIRMIDVFRTADMLVRKAVAAKEGEQVLIITDSGFEFLIVNALAAAARSVGGEPTIAIMAKPEEATPTLVVQRAIEGADIVFTCSTRSIEHSPLKPRPLTVYLRCSRSMMNWGR